MPHVWIALEQDAEGWPPVTEEEVRTEEIGENLHRITSTPVFVPGVAVGDVLATETQPDASVWAVAVAEQGNHWCSRVVPLGGFDPERIVEVFDSMGARTTLTRYGIVTLDVGPGIDARHVLDELEAGRAEGDWDFDLGVTPELG